MKFCRATTAMALALLLTGCGSLDRLSSVGRPPPMTGSSDPTLAADYRPLTLPMPARQAPPSDDASLWRSGSRAFFKDQRAANVGDIITVLVNITDAADVEDGTEADREGKENLGVPSFFGLSSKVKLLAAATGGSLVSTDSTNSNTATGVIKRNETVTLRVAGVITQVLPNGNLVVAARQEVRVNSELRVLQVTGVARPQDIASDNTVTHDRLAEARISYGGAGQLTDLQTPRYGQQIFDILSPF